MFKVQYGLYVQAKVQYGLYVQAKVQYGLHVQAKVQYGLHVQAKVQYGLYVQAKERRDDKNPDYNAVEETLPSTSSYRAVAPAALVDP